MVEKQLGFFGEKKLGAKIVVEMREREKKGQFFRGGVQCPPPHPLIEGTRIHSNEE